MEHRLRRIPLVYVTQVSHTQEESACFYFISDVIHIIWSQKSLSF